MLKILLIGSYSLLGTGLIKKSPKNVKLFLTHHLNQFKTPNVNSFYLDITDGIQTENLLLALKPDVIIHAAATSNVDWCEKNQKRAWEINVRGTQYIAEVANKTGSKVIFISTNAVFDGKHPPYNENSSVSPVNFYGKTKAQGEKIILSLQTSYLIIRLITMFGWQPQGARENPVTWELNLLRKGKALYMVTDRFITPLYNMEAAGIIWELIEKKKEGIYHIAGADRVSRFHWASLVAEIFGFKKNLVRPVKSSFFPKLALRPYDTSFSTTKIEDELNIQPLTIKGALKSMRNEKTD